MKLKALLFLATTVHSQSFVDLYELDEQHFQMPAFYQKHEYGPCNITADCLEASYYDCIEGECIHKPVFPAYPIEWWGDVVFAIIMALCNIRGIGGGGIHIPMIMAFYKFPTKEAVAISSLTIIMSAGTKYLYYWR